jgi:hypothetical protein
MVAATNTSQIFESKGNNLNQRCDVLSTIYILVRFAPQLIEKGLVEENGPEDIEKRNLRIQSHKLWLKNCSLSKSLKFKSSELARARQESEEKFEEQTSKISKLDVQVRKLKKEIALMDGACKDSITKLLYQNAKLDKMVNIQKKNASKAQSALLSSGEVKSKSSKKSFRIRHK